jgi:hypothetical protein
MSEDKNENRRQINKHSQSSKDKGRKIPMANLGAGK